MALLGRDSEGETTERQYAAMAEKLGRKLEAGLGGGKAQLLKALKVNCICVALSRSLPTLF
jgi:hypothetical protein